MNTNGQFSIYFQQSAQKTKYYRLDTKINIDAKIGRMKFSHVCDEFWPLNNALVQYATQKPGQNNKGKWKLSNLINNKCEKDESTRSKEIIILSAMRPMIKGNREKNKSSSTLFRKSR